MAGPEDTFVAYGTGWSNTPFRGYKHDGYEGGISAPLIVHWPAGNPQRHRGRFVRNPSHLIDVMATFVDVAGAEYPEVIADTPIQPLEGISLMPALRGEAIERAAPLCFEHHGNLAMRDGRWRIVSAYRANQPTKWELYDMAADRTKLNDLAEKQPQKLREMVAKWQAWADHVGVQPWPIKRKK